MEEYIGVKKIKAEPYTMTTTLEEDGYKVVYEDGYESWSPKKVFEKAYKKIKGIKDCKDINHGIAHQSRVLDEANDLNLNIYKLESFILINSTFRTLPLDEQDRMNQQLIAMKYYLTILVERINNFKSDETI